MLKKLPSILWAFTLIVLLGFTIRYFYYSTSDSHANISSAPLFKSHMADIQAKPQPLSQYQGKVIVLNFWATWCPPCRDEMPELSELQLAYQSKNVVVLGIAVDELNLVQEYLQASPVNYPILIADYAGMDLSEQLGNDHGILPYTVIIDSHGEVIKTFLGRISRPALEPVLQPLLAP